MILNKINKKAFSIAEIILAITLLVLVFLGIFQSFPYALTAIKASEIKTEAAYLAQSKMEELLSLDYDSIPVGTIEPRQRLGAVGTYLYNFERETIVEYVDANLTPSAIDTGLKKITTIVYYTNTVSKNEQSYIINTLVSELN